MSAQTTVPSPKKHIKPPAHLSEFYNFVDNSPENAGFTHDTRSDAGLSKNVPKTPPIGPMEGQVTTPSGSPTKSMPYFRSPAASRTESCQTSMSPSTMDLETLITNNDVNETLGCYESLIKASEKYRAALNMLDSAAGEFGSSLERCARLKGTGKACDGLMACSGLQYLIANQQQILVRNLEADFEKPVRMIISDFSNRHKSTEEEFTKLINDKVRQLKLNEKTNIKLSKKKYRNIISYRTNLQQLTQQLDEIDKLKHDYYVSLFEQVQSASESILDKARDIVSLETTIYDIIAKKSAIGGGLDDLLEDSEILELSARESTPKTNTAGSDNGSGELEVNGSASTVVGKAEIRALSNGSPSSGENEHLKDHYSANEDVSDLENDRRYMENAISTLHTQGSPKKVGNRGLTGNGSEAKAVSEAEDLNESCGEDDKENTDGDKINEDTSGDKDNEDLDEDGMTSVSNNEDREAGNDQNDTYYTPPVVKIVEKGSDDQSIESEEAQQSPIDTSNVLKDLNGVSSDSLKDSK